MPKVDDGGWRAWVGIDPGASGAMAAVFSDGRVLTVPNSFTALDRWEKIHAWAGLNLYASDGVKGHIWAVIERVSAMPTDGVASAFKFGSSFGELRAFLVAAGVPFEETPPQGWLKTFGMKRKKTETRTQWKNRLKAKAQSLFPAVKVTLATADALLIAEHCRRTRGG